MPMLDFKCPECGLKFEAFVRDRDRETHECEDCESEASRSEVSGFSFVFGDGETPGNTGVDSLDSSIDKAVGRDADRRWEFIKDRKSRKRKVKRQEGSEDTPLRKNPETGEYEPMENNEVSRFQSMHSEYADMYEKHKKKREEEGVPKFKEGDPYTKKNNEDDDS